MFLLVVWITLGNMEYGIGQGTVWDTRENNANEHEHRQDSMEETYLFLIYITLLIFRLIVKILLTNSFAPKVLLMISVLFVLLLLVLLFTHIM